VKWWWKQDAQKSNTGGEVMKLDRAAFKKLDLFRRLSELMRDSGFTDEEINQMRPHMDLEETAFSAYALAYVTWDKPTEISRADLDGMVANVAAKCFAAANLSLEDNAMIEWLLPKLKRMMSAAFDLGRHDADSQRSDS
jgi:hypothetical protein